MLTVEELAAAAGVSTEAVDRWHALGLLVGDGEHFPLEDLERARLILYATRRGIEPEAVAEACRAQGDLLGSFVAMMAGASPRRGEALEHARAVSGLDAETVERLWLAAGLGDQDEAFDEDIEAVQGFKVALEAGLPEEALVQLIHVYADALGRVAEAESKLFHHYVHERLRADGLQGDELATATRAVSGPLEGLMEPAIRYFHEKALQRAERDDFIVHLAEATNPPGETVGEMTTTIVFVDLSGFTPLTESMGDAAAAHVMARFSELVRHAASRHDGRLVKQIGDEFMLTFADPSSAVACGLAIDDAVKAEPQFPAVRIGAHRGSVLHREGDYIGTTVNVAARVASLAEPSQLLITEDLCATLRGLDDVDVVGIGPRDLKGISGAIELYRVQRAAARPDRVVDPVCRMTLGDAGAVRTVSWRGHDISFCSDSCAELFAADPERYVS